MTKSNELSSDHPLFRILVLMGGGLTLSCGGVARSEPPQPAASSGAGGAIDAGGAIGASGAIGTAGSIGASGAPTSAGGFGGMDPGAAGSTSAGGGMPALLDCPTEQYNCQGLTKGDCSGYDDFNLFDQLQTGSCVCDRSRPTSVKDCKPNENLVCRQAYLDGVQATTWNGWLQVQCACIASPIPATYDNCLPACAQAFPGTSGMQHCQLPDP